MTEPQRKIIHVDMDAFYASVEQRDRPELRGKPVVVGGRPGGRGVVASASYEARKFGVRSAMPSTRAGRLCPQAVFVEPDISKYVKVGKQIRAIFHEATDLVEPLSLDEAYLDVTRNKLGIELARDIAVLLKKRIRDELQLTASAGVGPNKFIAKVASDLRKPDGLVVVPPSKVRDFVRDLPIERFWGVGPATAKRLHAMGIRTAQDIRNKVEDAGTGMIALEKELGKFAQFLVGLAYGEDSREVDPSDDPKSRGTETTFDRDILDTSALLGVVEEQAEELAQDLRKIERAGRTVTLKLRYSDFTTITRSRTVERPIEEAPLIARIAGELLLSGTEAGSRPVRLLGISVSGFIGRDEPLQLSLGPPLTL